MSNKRPSPTTQLQEMIEQAGYKITLWVPTRGAWRREDVMRWQAYVLDSAGNNRIIGSWETVGDCIRKGVIIRDGTSDGCSDLEALSVEE